ncbi:hypothetical protein B188_22930 [Candidatus Brocadiaceae bacterium B188]|nr:hypothetical protein B188_22930 [Candidatus Brocadiaceae bacterium B188]
MLNIPVALFTKYSMLLSKKSVPVSIHNNNPRYVARVVYRSTERASVLTRKTHDEVPRTADHTCHRPRLRKGSALSFSKN